MPENTTMQGKTVLITGAGSGIGRETARGLALAGASIVMTCTSREKTGPVCDALKKETGNSAIDLMHLDLASPESIREFAAEFSRRYTHLHVLINNAGIFSLKRQETPQGFERTVAVNYLGPFLLTRLLLPVITQTAGSRIINVASDAYTQGRIDPDDFHLQKNYSGIKAYGASKFALILFTLELADRLRHTGVTVNVLHPGTVATGIWQLWPGTWYQGLIDRVMGMFSSTTGEAARTSICLAASAAVQGITGAYFAKEKQKDLAPKCMDADLQKRLWQLSEKLTGLNKGSFNDVHPAGIAL
jgi:NAD(P)-dependent dehydrogenase (short-subunit alcohol dehydrogenase family)